MCLSHPWSKWNKTSNLKHETSELKQWNRQEPLQQWHIEATYIFSACSIVESSPTIVVQVEFRLGPDLNNCSYLVLWELRFVEPLRVRHFTYSRIKNNIKDPSLGIIIDPDSPQHPTGSNESFKLRKLIYVCNVPPGLDFGRTSADSITITLSPRTERKQHIN